MARTWLAVAAIGATLALPGSSAADDVPVYGTSTVVGQLPGGKCCVSQIAVADFNGDGLEDAIFTRTAFREQDTFPVYVLLNDGHGKFVEATSAIFIGSAPVTQHARELVVADFNGDQRPDVFVADHGADSDPFAGFQNTLILSAPGGKLVDATANLPQRSDFTHSAAAGDVNGDGKTDIYAGNIPSGSTVPPYVLLNDGSGVFSVGSGVLPAAHTDDAAGSYTSSLFVDVNGDGKSDLVLGGDTLTPASVVLLNDGAGHLTKLDDAFPAKPFGSDAIALNIAALDVNGDPDPDLLIAFTKNNPFYVGRWTQVLINNGDGTFRDETSSRLPQVDNNDAWPVFFKLRDLNRDGRTDFGVLVNGGATVGPGFFVADALGVFQPGPAANVGSLWTFIDARGDGSNDILSVTFSGAVSLFPEHPTSAPPPGGAARDTTRPRLRVAVRRTHKLRSVLRNGLLVTVGCSEACRLSMRLVLVSRRGLGTARATTVGRASGRLAAAGRKKITVKLTRRARASFRGKRRVTLTLRATATDTAHNTSRGSTKIVLKR